MNVTVIEKFTTALKLQTIRLNVCFLEHIFYRKQNHVPALKSKKNKQFIIIKRILSLFTYLKGRPIITLFHIKLEEKKFPKNDGREKEKAPLNILMLSRAI